MKKIILLIFVVLLIDLSCISAQKYALKVTEEHPFYVDNEWIPAKNLKIGDLLFTDDGKKANDIDLIIIRDFNKAKSKEFEKKYNIKFHLINLNKLKEVNSSLKEEIKKKHLIVQDSEKVIKWILKN